MCIPESVESNPKFWAALSDEELLGGFYYHDRIRDKYKEELQKRSVPLQEFKDINN